MNSLVRHEQIVAAIENGNTPVLPFEIGLAEADFRGHVLEQNTLGKALGEAMDQSSETWHDNAPAEVIATASRVLKERAERAAHVVANGTVFDYPKSDEPSVTLGSLVKYRFQPDTRVECLYVTGKSRKVPKSFVESLQAISACACDEVEVATVGSPLVASMLGRVVGETFDYSPNGKKSFAVEIEGIVQFNPEEAV